MWQIIFEGKVRTICVLKSQLEFWVKGFEFELETTVGVWGWRFGARCSKFEVQSLRLGIPESDLRLGQTRLVDATWIFHTCLIDVPYLIRYEAYTGHLRDIYGTSCLLPARVIVDYLYIDYWVVAAEGWVFSGWGDLYCTGSNCLWVVAILLRLKRR